MVVRVCDVCSHSGRCLGPLGRFRCSSLARMQSVCCCCFVGPRGLCRWEMQPHEVESLSRPMFGECLSWRLLRGRILGGCTSTQQVCRWRGVQRASLVLCFDVQRCQGMSASSTHSSSKLRSPDLTSLAFFGAFSGLHVVWCVCLCVWSVGIVSLRVTSRGVLMVGANTMWPALVCALSAPLLLLTRP